MADPEFIGRHRWNSLIVDEAHRLKNDESQLYQQLSQEVHFDHVLLMTGTPVQNNLNELYSLLSFCNQSRFPLSARESFVQKHARQLDTLKPILDEYMLRRTKEQVGLDIPEKSDILLYHGLTPLQKDVYKNILKRNHGAFTSASNGKRNRLMNTLVQLNKCTSHPYLFHGE